MRESTNVNQYNIKELINPCLQDSWNVLAYILRGQWEGSGLFMITHQDDATINLNAIHTSVLDSAVNTIFDTAWEEGGGGGGGGAYNMH